MLFHAEVTVTAAWGVSGDSLLAVPDQLAQRLTATSWDAPEWHGHERALRAAGLPVEPFEPVAWFLDVPVEAQDAQTAERYLRARVELPDGWSLRSVAAYEELWTRPCERSVGEGVELNPIIPSVDHRDIEQGSRGIVEEVERTGLRRPRYLVRCDGQHDGTRRGWVIGEELLDRPPPSAPAPTAQ